MATIKPDLIVCWPTTLDYPGFRSQLKKYRDCFAKVIIAFSNHHAFPEIHSWFPAWLEQAMVDDNVEFISWEEVQADSSPDWAQRLSNCAWKRVTSPYMFWTQQDFVVHNPTLYEKVFDDQYKLVTHLSDKTEAYRNISRCEPDFIFMEMDLLRQTSMDVRPDKKADHWGKLSLEVYKLCPEYKILEDFDLETPRDWEHFGGLSSNYGALMLGNTDIFYLRKRFIDYNRELLNSSWNVSVHPYFENIIHQAAELNYE